MDRYFTQVVKGKYIILLLLVVVFVFLLPMGYLAFDNIAPEFGLEDLGTDQDVFTFTSVTDDIIFVLDGDENIISESFQDWTSAFAFDLQNHPAIQQYAIDATPIEHIFESTANLLRSYYVNVYSVMGFANVSTFIAIEGTQLFLDTWQNQIGEPNTTEVVATISEGFSNEVKSLAFGVLYSDIITFWLTKLANTLEDEAPGDISYTDILSVWRTNPDDWTPPGISDDIVNGFQFLLTTLEGEDLWEEDVIARLTSQFLFGNTEQESKDFLLDIFDNAHSSTRPTVLAREARLPFLRLEKDIPGFPEDIRKYYLTAFTNSDGDTIPTSLIMRVSLRSDLTEEELDIVFSSMNNMVDDYTAILPEGYDMAFLSFLNYQKERSDLISQEMHQIDLIAVIVGILILAVILRNPVYAVFTVVLAWSSTQVARGFVILLSPVIGSINGTSFSITTTFMLGAAMNYCVFFTFRYLQEMANDEKDAVIKSSNTAIHSILISGIAIVLAMIPYSFSSTELLTEMSISLIVGMLFQTIILIHLLPTAFGIVNDFTTAHASRSIPKIPSFTIKMTDTQVKRILITCLLLGIVALLIISLLNSTFVATDLIGDSGETGKALKIYEEKFPPNYLSRYLISMEMEQTVFVNNEFNSSYLDIVGKYSAKMSRVDDIESVISIAWPLNQPFDFDNTSIGAVEYQAAKTVAESLVEGNRTFIILQSTLASNSEHLSAQAFEIKDIVEDLEREKLVVSSVMTGLPAEVADLTGALGRELAVQITVAVLLLTIFLTLVLKSLFVPLRLLFSIILANVYSIAITSLLYKVLTGLPLNLIIISSSFLVLLGLGTDFDIYLIRRIDEEKQTAVSYAEAVEQGISKSATAIVGSGLVMGFSFLALFSADISLVQQFGLISFVTILIDIFFVRTVLVPAILLFASKRSS